MSNTGNLLTNDEVRQVAGGEKNETISEQEQTNADFRLMEHPWLLTGMIVGGVVVFAVYVYFCYKCCKAVSSLDGDYVGYRPMRYGYNDRDNYFMEKYRYRV